MKSDKPTPLYIKLLAATLLVLLVVAFIVFHHRIGADFWPPDRSTLAPNLVAAIIQSILVFLVVVALWPPWRRRLHRFVDKKLDKLHARHDDLEASVKKLLQHHEQHHKDLEHITQRLEELHDKVDTHYAGNASPNQVHQPEEPEAGTDLGEPDQ